MDKIKSAVVLMLVGVCSGLLIFLAYSFTAPIIEDNKNDNEKSTIEEIYPDIDNFNKEDIDNTYIVEVTYVYDKDSNLLGYVYKGSDTNNYGDMTIFVAIGTDNIIDGVEIVSTGNTSTFVNKIGSNVDAFVGLDVSASIEADTGTGATYSYTSIYNIVNAASSVHMNMEDE